MLLAASVLGGVGVALAVLSAATRASAAPAGEATAATLFVTPNGSGACTQAAPCSLATANVLALPGDTIYVAAGTYTGTGDAVLNLGKSVTLYGGWDGAPSGAVTRDPALYPTVLDGENARRVVGIQGNITPTLDGFVITRGNANGLSALCDAFMAHGCGGGVFVDEAHPRILNNQIVSNTALVSSPTYAQGSGGGIHLDFANGAIISGNVFLSNTAAAAHQGLGGGLAVHGAISVIIAGNYFAGNSGEPWGGGLALDAYSQGVVQANTFHGNSADQGAGLYTWYADYRVNGNTFTGNSGTSPVYLGFFGGLFYGNRVVDNAAYYGLQLVNGHPLQAPRLINNLLMRNGPDGIYVTAGVPFQAEPTFIHNTLVGSAGGNALYFHQGTITATLTNTLITNFATGVAVASQSTTTVDMHYTMFDVSVATTGPSNQHFPITGLAALGADGGLLAYSSARDAGVVVNGVTYDIDGDPRPIGPAVDIGADETRQAHALRLPAIGR